MQQVYVAGHPMDAHLVKGFLEAHGVAAVVRGETLFGVRGEAPMTADTLPTVWVLDDGAVGRARDLIAEYLQRRAADAAHGHPWQCPTCGERVEPQFTECWRCGTARPSLG
jgi:hypothetical protein